MWKLIIKIILSTLLNFRENDLRKNVIRFRKPAFSRENAFPSLPVLFSEAYREYNYFPHISMQ